MQVAEKQIAELITKLSSEIGKDSEVIERKRKRCDPEELDDLRFDVANKCQRLNKLQTDSKEQRKRAKRHTYLMWRSGLRRQLGKNRNRARIDRGAKTAVYNVLYEQLKAHDRRWGDEGTGYLEGKRIIFKNGSPYRRYVVRRALDDKAYLRCGTSEGFNRPIHTPVQISQDNLQFKLPASDYPQECGYVSPGVVLLVNNTNEVSYKDTDRYVRDDVTVTVTCKPKLVYPSTAANWFNDLYRVRYLFPQEHELEKTVLNEQNYDPQYSKEPTSETHQSDEQTSNTKQSNDKTSSRDMLTWLSVVRDSLFQFEMMTVKEDYIRCIDGGDHHRRELIRINILLLRLERVLPMLEVADENILTEMRAVMDCLQKLKGILLVF